MAWESLDPLDYNSCPGSCSGMCPILEHRPQTLDSAAQRHCCLSGWLRTHFTQPSWTSFDRRHWKEEEFGLRYEVSYFVCTLWFFVFPKQVGVVGLRHLAEALFSLSEEITCISVSSLSFKGSSVTSRQGCIKSYGTGSENWLSSSSPRFSVWTHCKPTLTITSLSIRKLILR